MNYSYSNEFNSNDTKMYVLPGTTFVGANALYVNLDGTFIPVSAISLDDGGVFVILDQEAARGKPEYCPICKGYHLPDICPRR